MLPSASELSYFHEVASSQNLTRAAERLGISQPSLSIAMQRLEHNIGAALLIRSRKGVALTQAGKQLLAHTRVMLQQWNQVKDKAAASMDAVEGSYVLGCHPSVALFSLPFFMPQLFEKHPKLTLRLKHDLSRKITEAVVRMEVDIGIVVNPISHPDLIIKKVCTDSVTFFARTDSVPTKLHPQQLIICDPDLLQTKALLEQEKKRGMDFARIMGTSSLELIAKLTAHGAGVGILPSRVTRANCGDALSPIANSASYQDRICVVYRMENKGVRSIKTIAEIIKETFVKTI